MDDDDEHDAGDFDGDDDVFGVIKVSWHETLISLIGLLVDCPLCNNSRHGGGDSAQRKWIVCFTCFCNLVTLHIHKIAEGTQIP